MFILLEKITPYENYFEFECFFNDIEINYSNRLFDIKAYLLVSSHKSFGNRLDAVILPDSSNFINLEFSRKDLQPIAHIIFAQGAKIPHRRAKRF